MKRCELSITEMNKMDEQNLKFNTEEAAAYLQSAVGTLENWRSKGTGPVYYKPAGKVFYLKRDLDEWIEGGRK